MIKRQGKSSSLPLNHVIALFPISKWGLEFIGPTSLPSYVGHAFILFAINYFTQWTKAIPLKTTKAKQVRSFLQENIFSHFRLLCEISNDNGGAFVSRRS